MFAKLKFNVAQDIVDLDPLKEAIVENGGELSEKFDVEPSQELICVVDKFEGEQFQKLCDSGARIVGAKCIHDSVKVQKPLPVTSHPIYALHLEGLKVCITGLPKKRREEIKNLIQYMGGQYVNMISENTTYLIATKVGSIKYKLAAQNEVTALLPEWIVECWNIKSLVAIDKFLLPPFAGCVISVTGLSATSRNEISRLVKAYGGEYTPNLTKKCTHLLSEAPTGLKYRYALEWGVHCVTVQWFLESINTQKCVDETKHFHPLDGHQRKRLFNPLCTSTRDLNRLSPALRRKHLMALKRRYNGTADKNRPYDIQALTATATPIYISPSLIRGQGLNLTSFQTNTSALPILNIATGPNDAEKNKADDLPQPNEPPYTGLVNYLYNTLDVCNKVIEQYTNMAKERDLSPEIDTLKRKLEEPSNYYDPDSRPLKKRKISSLLGTSYLSPI